MLGSMKHLPSLVVVASALLAAGCADRGPEAPPPSPSAPFAPSPEEPGAVVWAVGDGADETSEGRTLARRIAASSPDRLLYLGDVYEEGTAEDFRENYASTYGPLAARTAPTPGNHDWPNHATGYDAYWADALGRPIPPYYSFHEAGWEVLSLNSELPQDRGSPQRRWLEQALRGPGNCRIAFWHRPRISAGEKHGDEEDMQALWELLPGRTAIALAGHEHNMQRMRPIDGVTEFVSGAGGSERIDDVEGTDDRIAFADDDRYGALRLVLRPGVAHFTFVTLEGEVLDRGSVPCRQRNE